MEKVKHFIQLTIPTLIAGTAVIVVSYFWILPDFDRCSGALELGGLGCGLALSIIFFLKFLPIFIASSVFAIILAGLFVKTFYQSKFAPVPPIVYLVTGLLLMFTVINLGLILIVFIAMSASVLVALLIAESKPPLHKESKPRITQA